jgi:hypothetical protein
MSALLDSLTSGGYTGDTTDTGVGASSGAYYVQSPVDSSSGYFQQLAALGTGALSRYIDYDLQRRMIGSMPQPMIGTTQNPVGGYAGVTRTQNGQQVASINLSALMPLALVAVAVFLLARKA